MSWGYLGFAGFYLTRTGLSVRITLLKLIIMGCTVVYNNINNSLAF